MNAAISESSSPAQPSRLTFAIDAAAPASPLPPIGLGMASHGAPLTATEISRLRALNLRHLRVDLVLADPAYPARLRQATAEAQALGVPLEIALRISPDSADGELAALRRLLDALRPNVCRWLVFPAKELFRGGSLLREVIEPARTHLAGYGDAALVSGTDADFIFLARSLPPLELGRRADLRHHRRRCTRSTMRPSSRHWRRKGRPPCTAGQRSWRQGNRCTSAR